MKVGIASAVLGVLFIVITLGDAFETIVFPRRVTRRVRLARVFFRCTWRFWSASVRSLASGRRQETLLSFYGPFSLLILLAIWATGLVVGFALLHFASGSAINVAGEPPGFYTDLYLSGTTFFTLGLGDVTPRTPLARVLTVFEAGVGFGFLALVIGFLPGLNQSFSRREVNISLLDSRAGSPSTAAEMFLRHRYDHGLEALQQLFNEWERWSAELLESHLSYPVLAYFRSQHDNQSWLGALTTVLDACALAMVGVEGACARQAELTFAMARHALVDLSIVFGVSPKETGYDRLSVSDLVYLREKLTAAGLRLREGANADQKLAELRRMYEPYVYSLGKYLCISIPPWITGSPLTDNWQTSPWQQDSDLRKTGRLGRPGDRHF